MKRFWALAILLMVLTGCRSTAPGGGRCDQGLCVKIEVAEPIRWGESVKVTITVTSDHEVSDLGVWLNYEQGTIVEGPQDWEPETRDRRINEDAASWKIDIKANKPAVFVRKVYLPLAEREFKLSAAVYRADLGYITDSVYIHLTRKGGKVYYSGTPLPTIPLEGIPLGRGMTSEGVDCSPGPCLTIRVIEPVRWGEPVRVLLQVEGRKEESTMFLPLSQKTIPIPADFPQLGLTFWASDPSIQVKPEKGEFNEQRLWPAGNGVWWIADVWANSAQEYAFLVNFPPEERIYQLQADAFDPRLGQVVSLDFVQIELRREGGKVFAPSLGTPLPTATPWPTPFPTPTFPPPYPFLSPISTPTPLPYPFLSPILTPAPTVSP